MGTLRNDSRGVTPLIGVIAMIAIVFALASLTALVFFGFQMNISEGPPDTTFQTQQADGTIVLTHATGDDIDGSRLDVQGAAYANIPDTVTAGTAIEIVAFEDEVIVIWSAEQNESYPIGSFDSTYTAPSIITDDQQVDEDQLTVTNSVGEELRAGDLEIVSEYADDGSFRLDDLSDVDTDDTLAVGDGIRIEHTTERTCGHVDIDGFCRVNPDKGDRFALRHTGEESVTLSDVELEGDWDARTREGFGSGLEGSIEVEFGV